MATKTNTTDLRKFDSIDVEFYRNKNQQVTDFGQYEVTKFHFEEGISHPYTGTLTLATEKAIHLALFDLNYVYAKITYSIKYQDGSQRTDKRTVWALVKAISDLARLNKANSDIANDKLNFLYLIQLESPLARLCNNSPKFENKKISAIILELLGRGDQQNTEYNPLLTKIDVSKIETLAELDTSKLCIQRGQEDVTSFFNRLLIGYGINYIFDFDENNGVTLIFSRDQEYRAQTPLICSDNEADAQQNTNVVFLSNHSSQKELVDYTKTLATALYLKNDWIDIQIDRTDTSGLKESQIKFIFKNIYLREGKLNPKLTSNNIQDIRLEPGLKVDSNIYGIASKHVVRTIVTDINNDLSNSNKNNTVAVDVELLELIDIPDFKPVADDVDGNYFEFDPKSELGSLVPQKIASISRLEAKQAIDILEAKACDKDGNVNTSLAAEYVNDCGENNDLFYAYITGQNSNLVIEVHSLIDADSSNIKNIMQGQRIMVLAKGGAYYLYGYVPHHLSVEKDKLEALSQDIFNLKKDSSISLKNYKTNAEYIYSLLKTSPQAVEDAVIMQALDSADASIHDTTYLDTYKDTVKTKHLHYKSCLSQLQQALSALYKKYEDGHFLASYINSDGSLNSNAPTELQSVKKCKDNLTASLNDLMALSKDIVKDCEISFIKEEQPKQLLQFTNPDGFKFNSDNGDLEINADNINIVGKKSITINAPSVKTSSSGSIKSAVGSSYIETKASGTTVYAGITTFGYAADQDGNDASEYISSKFCVEGFNGISGSAFNVTLNGNNQLSLNGPLGAGMTLGYGFVKLVGSEVNLTTLGKVEQAKNITLASAKTIADLAISCSSGSKSTVGKGFIKGINLVSKWWDLSFGPTGAAQRCCKANKSRKEGKLSENASGYVMARYDFADQIIRILFSIADFVLQSVKYVYEMYDTSKDIKSETVAPCDSIYKRWYEQATLYITYIKSLYSLIGAGFKASQGVDGLLQPKVSTVSIGSSKITFSGNKLESKVADMEQFISPAAGVVEGIARQVMTGTEQKIEEQTANIDLNDNNAGMKENNENDNGDQLI